MEGTSDIPLHMLPGLAASMKVMQAAELKDAKKTSSGMESMGNRTPRPSAPMVESYDAPEVELLSEIPRQSIQPNQKPQMQTANRPMNENSIQNSNLSPEIKKLMMDNQIDDPATYVNPTLGVTENTRTDLMGITEDVAPKTIPLNEYKAPVAPLAEPTTDTSNIRQIVREEIQQVMSETYTNKIRKKAIEDTMRTLKSKGLLK